MTFTCVLTISRSLLAPSRLKASLLSKPALCRVLLPSKLLALQGYSLTLLETVEDTSASDSSCTSISPDPPSDIRMFFIHLRSTGFTERALQRFREYDAC